MLMCRDAVGKGKVSEYRSVTAVGLCVWLGSVREGRPEVSRHLFSAFSYPFDVFLLAVVPQRVSPRASFCLSFPVTRLRTERQVNTHN